MHELVPTPTFERSFARLDRTVAVQAIERLERFAEQPSGYTRIRHLPKDLSGLLKFRIGDYRVAFWLEVKQKRIILYLIAHRREIYRILTGR